MHPNNLTDSVSQIVGSWETQALSVAGSHTATQSTRGDFYLQSAKDPTLCSIAQTSWVQTERGAAAMSCLHQDVSAADEMASVPEKDLA